MSSSSASSTYVLSMYRASLSSFARGGFAFRMIRQSQFVKAAERDSVTNWLPCLGEESDAMLMYSHSKTGKTHRKPVTDNVRHIEYVLEH